MFTERLLSRRADRRLFDTVGLWKLKLRWPVDVSTLDSSTPPVDADRRRGRPGTLSTVYIFSVGRYAGATPWIHFHTRTEVLKMMLRRNVSRWRLRRTDVIWFRRHSRSSAMSLAYIPVYTSIYAAVYTMVLCLPVRLSVCQFVRHKSEFYQNVLT